MLCLHEHHHKQIQSSRYTIKRLQPWSLHLAQVNHQLASSIINPELICLCSSCVIEPSTSAPVINSHYSVPASVDASLGWADANRISTLLQNSLYITMHIWATCSAAVEPTEASPDWITFRGLKCLPGNHNLTLGSLTLWYNLLNSHSVLSTHWYFDFLIGTWPHWG